MEGVEDVAMQENKSFAAWPLYAGQWRVDVQKRGPDAPNTGHLRAMHLC